MTGEEFLNGLCRVIANGAKLSQSVRQSITFVAVALLTLKASHDLRYRHH